jgi:cell division protein FtsQ
MPQISPKYRKDYRNPDYRNLIIARDKEKIRKRIMRAVVFASLAVILGLGYFLFFSPLFRIKNVEINGLEKIKRENIEQIINGQLEQNKWLIFSRRNFWIFDGKELSNAIFSRYYFEEFKIDKRIPNRVIINLKEKQAIINWLTNNLCLHLDPSALAIEFCETNNGFITIKDTRNQSLKVGEYAVDSAELKRIVKLYDAIKIILADRLKLSQIEKDGDLLNFTAIDGVVIKLNLQLPDEVQISRFNVLMNQNDVKNNLSKLEYIDLRFGEKIYYK